MKIQLSPHDRFTVFFLFCKGSCPAGEDVLEARLKAWELLRLKDFDNKKIDPAKLSKVAAPFEITKPVADHVAQTCSIGGQNISLVLSSAAIVRKIRAVHPAPQPSNAAPP